MAYLRKWKWGLAVLLVGAGSAVLIGAESEGGHPALCVDCILPRSDAHEAASAPAPSGDVSIVDSVAQALTPKKGELYKMASAEEEPIVCTLSPADLAQRKTLTQTELVEKATGRKELENGMEFTFDGTPEMLVKLVDFIDHERACCSFLRFNLAFEPGAGGPVVLSMTGKAGVKEFLVGALEKM